jgi:transcriptional regulator with XRE-family HTH domain
MALFFDAEWFDARFAERGLSRGVLAAAVGIDEAELALAFKDQREISARDVARMAELLGAPVAEVASRAGVSTPAPGRGGYEQRMAALEARIARLEAEIAALKKR